MEKCKITVLKRTVNQDIADKYLSSEFKEKHPEYYDDSGACSLFQDGQEFIVDNIGVISEKFCAWAWADIQQVLVTVMYGGNLPWMQKSGMAVTCCTDGFRPVIFKVEKVE